MASPGNWFETRRKAHDLREKSVTSAYTVRVGGASDDFIVDRVIIIPSAAAAFTITLPDGKFRGQRFLAVITSSSTLGYNVTVSTGTNTYKLKYVRDYVSMEWIGSGDKGWIYLAKSAT